MADYDLAIIGGGLNGVSIARDAAGRGLRVVLLEQGDLGGGASAASPRMIHGDLAALERRSFLRVRRWLREREIWLRTAPHLVRPCRFTIPSHADERPSWLLRSGLLAYDRLGSGSCLPRSATLDVTHHPVGNALKRPFGTAFEYSDAMADDSRLVVAIARDAAARSADIRTGARCVRAERLDIWKLSVVDRGHRQTITTRALANASGAWAASVAETVLRMPPPPLALAQVSQIVVPRLFETDNVYVFQNSDGRLVFAAPYERDFTLIGSVGRAFKGDPAIVSVVSEDIAYLCGGVSRYFRERVDPSDVIRAVSGVNSVTEPMSRQVERDGALNFHAPRGKAPLLTVLGGDITTSRLRAEHAVAKLTPFYLMSPRWTATAALPGGQFDGRRFDAVVDDACERWPFLTEVQAGRLVAAYGSQLADVLGDAKTRDDLGLCFGGELTAAEVRYLMKNEWARFPDDILWRRSKLGLTMPPAGREALAAFMTDKTCGTSPPNG